jgi:hypothetical protein
VIESFEDIAAASVFFTWYLVDVSGEGAKLIFFNGVRAEVEIESLLNVYLPRFYDYLIGV